MKTFRELINLVESAQTSADSDVEHLANAFADIYYGGAGMGMISATEKIKLARNIVQAVEDGRLSIEELKQDLHDVDQLQKKLGRDGRFDEPGVAEGATVDYEVEWTDRNTGEQGITSVSALTQQDAEKKVVKIKLQQGDNIDVTDVFPAHKQNPVAEGTDKYAELKQKIRDLSAAGNEREARKQRHELNRLMMIDRDRKARGVDEALSKNDLLKQVVDKLNDPEFRKKPADPTKRWEKGDLNQGPGPDDYGYTGYQGHGMPTDRAEQARIRADKKKGVAEDTNQKYAVRMNAQQLGSTNRSKYTWTGTAGSDDQAREMAIAYADRHGFKNIVVKEISKQEQTVDEQATPEAVAKINSLFSK